MTFVPGNKNVFAREWINSVYINVRQLNIWYLVIMMVGYVCPLIYILKSFENVSVVR